MQLSHGNVENCRSVRYATLGDEVFSCPVTSTIRDFRTMTIRNMYNWPVAMALIMGLAACGGGGSTGTTNQDGDSLAVQPEGDGLIKVGNKLFSIPSPVQTVLLAQESNTPYESSLPLSLDMTDQFVSKEKQALALGMYGADLAYVTAYKDGQRALKTLKAVEQLGKQLNVSNAFDSDLMGSFQKNINNMDSLLRLTGRAFRAADMYLKTDQREDISTCVLAGGWIEGLYLSLGSTGDKVDPKLATRLAEQRHTLDNLIEMLGQGATATEADLATQLRDLAVSYKGMSSQYTFVEPTTDVANKTTYINSTSKAEIAPEALQEIIKKVRAIRASILA